MLLIRERNPTMKPYSRVLLLNAVLDYVYTIVSIVVEMEIELNQGTYIFVANGIPKEFSPHWQRVFVGVWMYALSSTCCASIVEFIFRYLHVVSVFAMGVGVALVGVQNGLLIYLTISSTDDLAAQFADRMSDPMWITDGKQAEFFCGDKSNFFLQLFLLAVCVEDTVVVLVMLFSTLSTLRTLERNREVMSAKVRYMQSQLNRLMFSEVFSLMTVFVIPIGTAMAFLILSVQWVGFGVLVTVFLEWVPAVNPITTILLVGPYRKQLIRTCMMKHKVRSVLSNTHKSQQQTTRALDRP